MHTHVFLRMGFLTNKQAIKNGLQSVGSVLAVCCLRDAIGQNRGLNCGQDRHRIGRVCSAHTLNAKETGACVKQVGYFILFLHTAMLTQLKCLHNTNTTMYIPACFD